MTIQAETTEPPGWRKRWARWTSYGLLENLFFIAAAIFSLMLAAVVLRKGVSKPGDVLFLVGFYLVLAYLALPRMHRILTALYVPDYYIGRTRTSDGLLGDPVNLALRGSREQIVQAMEAAGWVQADPLNLTSAWRMIRSALLRRSYPTAPVSALLLFGRAQDLTFQQEVDGSPTRRHHVRLWQCPPGWLLPGGAQVDWLAAGTFDRAVGLSLFTLQVTHKIEPHIDRERDHIVATLREAVPETTVAVLKDFTTGYHTRNGGGDSLQTDGALPVVILSEMPVNEDTLELTPGAEPTAALPMSRGLRQQGLWQQGPVSAHQMLDSVADTVGRRPVSLIAAFAMIIASLALETIDLAVGAYHDASDLADQSGIPRWITITVGSTVLGLAIIANLVFSWLVFKGYNWARIVLLAVTSGTLVSRLAQAIVRVPGSTDIFQMSLDVLVVYALTSRTARDWTHRQLDVRRARRMSSRPDARPASWPKSS